MMVFLRSKLLRELTKEERRRHHQEIGGFVLGKYREEDIVVLDRLVECTNVSDLPFVKYCPEEACTEKACKLVFRKDRGNIAITLFHTHPRDTFFSVEDVESLINLSKYLGIECIPAFLSTYNSEGHFLSYSLGHYTLISRFFEIESRPLEDRLKKHFSKLGSLADRIEYTVMQR